MVYCSNFDTRAKLGQTLTKWAQCSEYSQYSDTCMCNHPHTWACNHKNNVRVHISLSDIKRICALCPVCVVIELLVVPAVTVVVTFLSLGIFYCTCVTTQCTPGYYTVYYMPHSSFSMSLSIITLVTALFDTPSLRGIALLVTLLVTSVVPFLLHSLLPLLQRLSSNSTLDSRLHCLSLHSALCICH